MRFCQRCGTLASVASEQAEPICSERGLVAPHSYVDVDDVLMDQLAATLWYRAGAVIAWESAAPAVQERYRAKARTTWVRAAAVTT